MILKRSALLLLTCGALVAAGCGDDDDEGGSSDAPATTQAAPAEPTTTEESTTTEATTTEDSGGGANPSDPQVQAAVEQCQQSIDSNAQLSEGAKKELANVCKDAASGDEQAVKEASKKVCLKILEETGVEGPAAEQAKAACEAVAQ